MPDAGATTTIGPMTPWTPPTSSTRPSSPTSAQVSFTSASETNQFHGDALDFVRNDAFDARSFVDPVKPPFHLNQFGASAGGPIVRDRTFFCAAYERHRQSPGQTLIGFAPMESNPMGRPTENSLNKEGRNVFKTAGFNRSPIPRDPAPPHFGARSVASRRCKTDENQPNLRQQNISRNCFSSR